MGDFFNSSQFDHNQNAQSDSSSDRSGCNAHVSLSQIANLTRKEDLLVIHRQKIPTLTTIGRVVSVEELTTKNVYLLDDYTQGAPVEIQLWKNENDGTNFYVPPPTIMEKTYMRVVGQARYDDRKPFVVAFSVEPITNPNAIHTHFLEVIADSLILEKRKNATLNKMNLGSHPNASHMEIGQEFDQNNSRSSRFNQVQSSVLDILKKYATHNNGLKTYEIKGYMSGINGNLVDEAITFLANEGHIFSTNDEDTYKATDS